MKTRPILCRVQVTVFCVAAALAAMLHPAAAQNTPLIVMLSGGFAAPFKQIQPAFEKESGITVTIIPGKSQGPTPDTMSAQMRRGITADVVILSREGLNDLIAEKRIAAHSDVNIAKTPLGLAVRAGAPKPDISSVAAVKATLLAAKTVAYPSSTAGIYLVKTLLPRLGIAKQVLAKGNDVGIAAVAKGDAEIDVQAVSEILHVPGTDFVGPLPAGAQFISVFSAARVVGSKRDAEAAKLIAYLSSARAIAAIRGSGMEPLGVK